jgi:hypothetical protein
MVMELLIKIYVIVLWIIGLRIVMINGRWWYLVVLIAMELLIKIYEIVLWIIGLRICDDKMMLKIFGCIYLIMEIVDKVYVIELRNIELRMWW